MKTLNLENRYRPVVDAHRDLTFARRVCGLWVCILIVAIVVLIALAIRAMVEVPPQTIREVTPQERKQVREIEEKYRLKGFMWQIDRKTGAISYYKGGQWREVR